MITTDEPTFITVEGAKADSTIRWLQQMARQSARYEESLTILAKFAHKYNVHFADASDCWMIQHEGLNRPQQPTFAHFLEALLNELETQIKAKAETEKPQRVMAEFTGDTTAALFTPDYGLVYKPPVEAIGKPINPDGTVKS